MNRPNDKNNFKSQKCKENKAYLIHLISVFVV